MITRTRSVCGGTPATGVEADAIQGVNLVPQPVGNVDVGTSNISITKKDKKSIRNKTCYARTKK